MFQKLICRISLLTTERHYSEQNQMTLQLLQNIHLQYVQIYIYTISNCNYFIGKR